MEDGGYVSSKRQTNGLAKTTLALPSNVNVASRTRRFRSEANSKPNPPAIADVLFCKPSADDIGYISSNKLAAECRCHRACPPRFFGGSSSILRSEHDLSCILAIVCNADFLSSRRFFAFSPQALVIPCLDVLTFDFDSDAAF